MPGNCCIIDPNDMDCRVVLFSDRVVTARKPHECSECRDSILVGRLYSRETGKLDGAFCTFRLCARCRNTRDEYFLNGWIYGELRESFRECFGFDYCDGLPPDFAPCREHEK